MKTVIYTAIMGQKDELRNPVSVEKDFDYICFTDQPEKLKQTRTIWKIVGVPKVPDVIRAARKVKILAHKYVGRYDRSIWIDGKVRIIRPVRELLDLYVPPHKMLVWSHWQRNCIYKEALACIRLKKDTASILERQADAYRKWGFPSNVGLVRSEVLIRLHNDRAVQKVMEAWWTEIMSQSRRDQMSFNFVAWKLKLKFYTNRNQAEFNRYFAVYRHKK